MVNEIGYISKENFDSNIALKAKYGTYEKYQLAMLKTQSIHTFAKTNPNFTYNPSEAFFNMRMEAYDKHNATSEAMIANYKQLEAQYKALLGQQTALNNSLMTKHHVGNSNDLKSAMLTSNSLYDQGLYNKTASSVSEAYSNYISALQSANYQTHKLV